MPSPNGLRCDVIQPTPITRPNLHCRQRDHRHHPSPSQSIVRIAFRPPLTSPHPTRRATNSNMVDPSRSAGPSHAAFPSAAEYARYAPPAQTAPPPVRVPSSASELHALIQSQSTPRNLSSLIPVLDTLAGASLTDKTSARLSAHQNTLTLQGVNLATLTDEELRRYTAGYVFVLCVLWRDFDLTNMS